MKQQLDPLTDEPEELIPTRQSLLSRLKDWNDQESWKVFFDTYWRLIYGAAVKSGLKDAEAQDVVQETIIGVLKSMPSFQYRKEEGSFKSWLLQLTRWRVCDHLRRRRSEFRAGVGQSDASAIEDVADPAGLALEATWDEEWEKNLVRAALERVKQKVDPKAYQIFQLYVFKKWSVSRVAQGMKVNPAFVYLTKHKVGKIFKKEITLLKDKPI